MVSRKASSGQVVDTLEHKHRHSCRACVRGRPAYTVSVDVADVICNVGCLVAYS